MLSSGALRKSLPIHRSYHRYSPTLTVPPKNRYMFSSGIRIWLWSFHSSWGLLTAPWRRSHHYCRVTLAGTVEKAIAFGRYTVGMSFHWQLEAPSCASLLAPWASEAAGEEMDQMPWPSHLTHTLLRGQDVFLWCCSEATGAFWETWASGAHFCWQLRHPSVRTSLYGYTFCLNTVVN